MPLQDHDAIAVLNRITVDLLMDEVAWGDLSEKHVQTLITSLKASNEIPPDFAAITLDPENVMEELRSLLNNLGCYLPDVYDLDPLDDEGILSMDGERGTFLRRTAEWFLRCG